MLRLTQKVRLLSLWLRGWGGRCSLHLCCCVPSGLDDNPDHVDCPRAIAFIRAQWLNNRGESEVLTDELNRITYDESKSIQTFISEFAMLINNIEPIIPSRS